MIFPSLLPEPFANWPRELCTRIDSDDNCVACFFKSGFSCCQYIQQAPYKKLRLLGSVWAPFSQPRCCYAVPGLRVSAPRTVVQSGVFTGVPAIWVTSQTRSDPCLCTPHPCDGNSPYLSRQLFQPMISSHFTIADRKRKMRSRPKEPRFVAIGFPCPTTFESRYRRHLLSCHI